MANYALWIGLCTGVEFLPNADAALIHCAEHDGEARDFPRWRRRVCRMLVIQHGEVLPKDASAEMVVEALLRHDIVTGGWFSQDENDR